MARLAPEGDVYQAGTLAGNPLAMAAGAAMVGELMDHPELYDELDRGMRTLADGLIERARDRLRDYRRRTRE
jgi:glutamate-1-semialdehyde 2,1-aminomutase